MQYSWKVKEPSLNPLFKKNLSKHSVRAYMRLYHEVGNVKVQARECIQNRITE
ncbi:hypothetical protein BDW75DRAFT_226652 [Aspergillus navahoensis]